MVSLDLEVTWEMSVKGSIVISLPMRSYRLFKIAILVVVACGSIVGCKTGSPVMHSLPISSMPQWVRPQLKPQELIDWQRIEDNTDPRKFSEYVRKYPNGTFTQIARNRTDGGNSSKTQFKFDGIWETTYQFYGAYTPDCITADAFPVIIKRHNVEGAFEHSAGSTFYNGTINNQGEMQIKQGSGNVLVNSEGIFTQDSASGTMYAGWPLADVHCYMNWTAKRMSSKSIPAIQKTEPNSAGTVIPGRSETPSIASRLRQLDNLLNQHLISVQEYEQRRAEILKNL